MNANLVLPIAGIDPLFALVGAGFVVAVVFLAVAVHIGTNSEARRAKIRLARARGAGAQQGTIAAGAGPNLRLDTTDSSIAGVDKLIKKIVPRPMLMRRRLARTGRRITLGDYALYNLITVAIAFAAAYGFFDLPGLLALPVAVTLGLGVPHVAVGTMIKRRQRKFNLQFPEAIELIVRGLKSGLPVSESIQTIGREMPDPVGVEFGRVADSLKLGETLDEALWEVAQRLDTPEFKFFVISLSVQRETGGNLAETLENLAEILRKRKQMRLKVKALSAEARASAYILAALPFVMFAILSTVNPDYTFALIDDPRGQMMLGAALSSMLIGGLVMFKMARFEI